ncbi:DEAD/DEAH box helicase [Patescibacteria group bacterium]|nr:DEAD/DEAH box helicase [Patescibacteria group bacterium]MBU2036421.1 DEAD/DEAH box helicase [Patescibacteria group bacterium]
MYRQSRKQSFKRQKFNRYNGRSFRGTRRIKSFNPIDLINSPQISEKQEEYLISHSFSDFQISEELKRNIFEKGYKIPTPIQDQAIEPILEGRDLVGIANTGTGKTAAFLIPLINKVLKDSNQKVLILTPTRELATQIKNEFLMFSKSLRVYSCLCIGGENIKRQIRELSRNPQFIIATPGRIQDLIRSRVVNLSNFSSVVLDEADRMVDIGFIKDIKYIVSLLASNRQSLFFSATISNDVKQILQSFVRNPVTVSVKIKDTIDNISQKVVNFHDMNKKVDTLHDLLIQEDFSKVLIFGRTKHSVQRLSEELVMRGFKSGAIHGNKNQSQRRKVLEKFKRSEVQILVATDVASRGLDIPNVSHVINYDLPESYEAYIHRIGRTGRADKKGVALTFVN